MNILPTLPLTKIGFFNPGRLSDQEIEQIFVARIPLLELLFGKIIQETPGSIPQHYLLIGQRGMGKSSLLARLAAELRKPVYREKFIPLSFPEEQYNVDQLAKFWLNCMDALADAIDKEGNQSSLSELDATINRLARDREAGANIVYDSFQEWAARIGRRPVLLVDNLNLIFSTISKEEQHQLRAILMSRNAPVLVGASTDLPEETTDYSAPFYDAFQILYLNKLSFEEALQILINLAKITGKEKFTDEIYLHQPRLQALYALTGGSPRTLALLFPMVQDGFSNEVQTDLDGLLDAVTPLYKARFEELPSQQQVILDAIALNWDPVTLDKLRELTRLENPQISPQLKRLTETGWIQKISIDYTKSNAYEVSERFFNIWYLMRRSSRRQKRELYCLTKFLEVFYGDHLEQIAQQRLGLNHKNENQIALDLAFADAIKDKELSKQLREKSYESIAEILQKDDRILERFTLSGEFRNKKENETSKKMLTLFKSGQHLLAIEEGERGLRINVQSFLLWTLMGMNYTQLEGMDKKAEEAYLRAISLNEKYAFAWTGLGILYNFRLGKIEKAEQAYLKALALTEDKANILKLLGGVYQDELGRYAEAEQAYQKALSLDEKDVRIWNNLGNLYQIHLSKYSEAEQAYQKALSLDERDFYSWFGLGNLYQYHLRKYRDAEDAYMRAIESDEKSIFAWNSLGNLYKNHLGKYGEAERAYKKAIMLDVKYSYTWNRLGNLYQNHLGKFGEAELAFKKAILLDEKDPTPWNGLGNLYQDQLGKYAEAEQAYQKALELNPNEVYPKYNLIFLWRDKMGEIKKAHQLFESLALDKDVADSYWLHVALFTFYEGKIAEGELHLQKAINEVASGILPVNTRDDWYRSFAVLVKLGHSKIITRLMTAAEWDITMRPVYVAVQSLTAESPELFLNTVAAEVRDPARKIAEWMRNYIG